MCLLAFRAYVGPDRMTLRETNHAGTLAIQGNQAGCEYARLCSVGEFWVEVGKAGCQTAVLLFLVNRFPPWCFQLGPAPLVRQSGGRF